MGISQALLSHYEKGIRECGLDFLVKIADFYGVTTDFLLGHTVESVNEKQEELIHINRNMPMITKYRRNLNAGIDVIFDILSRCKNVPLSNSAYNFLSLSVYQTFRMIYSSNSSVPDEPFTISRHIYCALNNASLIVSSSQMADSTTDKSSEELTTLNLSCSEMKEKYEKKWHGTQKLLTTAEQFMNNLSFDKSNNEDRG